MKKSLLIVSTFLSAMTFAQNCTDLIISEYVEGVGNNKALEIYNPTANSINLSQYFVARLSNGSSIGSLTSTYTVQLSGTIAPYSTYVGVLDKRVSSGTGNEAPIWDELEAKADGFYSPIYNDNKTWYWNGNDCVMLAKGSASNPNAINTVLVDFFGKDGQNPENAGAGTLGWSSVAPYDFTSGNPLDRIVTEDHSMIRKATVLKGKNSAAEVFGGSYVFNPLLEYDSIPALIAKTDPITGDIIYQIDGVTPQWEGNWSSLGWHDCNCAPASLDEVSKSNISIFPNPSNGIFAIKGIDGISSIEVVNSLGQTVQSINSNINSMVKIDLSNRKGVYFVKLMDETGDLITKKVIIK